MCTNGAQVPCEVLSPPNPTTRKGWPDPYSFRIVMWVLLRPRRTNQWKCCETGPTGFSSLSEKTGKSNHLQMSLQKVHFLLSYLKTLSVGLAGVWTCDLPLGRPTLSQLPVLKLVVRSGALGFSVLRFWLFFRSVFRFFVAKDFGFSVLVVIAVCGFFVF